jgi:2-phosphoglycerate kinase
MVGIRASIDRAIEEGWSTVLEGIHLVPGMLPPIDGALVAQCVLTAESAEEHTTHFLIRDLATEGVRRQEKYLEHIDDIRRIQDHIVGRAKRLGVPVIESERIDATIAAVLELVLERAEQVQRV